MEIKANGISINYELTGSGKYFTLIHGAGDNLNAWYNQVPEFSRHYSVLTYDVRGHGKTEFPEGELTTETWIEDLYGLLKALGIDETILLGYSMGGSIALGFTIAHPEMVRALILSNSGIGRRNMSEEDMKNMQARRKNQLEALEKDGMEAEFRERVTGMFSPGFMDNHPETARRYREILLQTDPKKYLRVMGRMGPPASPPDTSKITCPTLIIAGELDFVGGADMAKASQAAIKDSKIKVFPTAHASAIEVPDEYNKTVLNFLSEAGMS
jgi:3-oxoadipate enol-lactonase